jgi:hypothetical protein
MHKLMALAPVDTTPPTLQTPELVDLVLVDFDYLITKKKVEEEDNFVDLVNNATRFETLAAGEEKAHICT